MTFNDDCSYFIGDLLCYNKMKRHFMLYVPAVTTVSKTGNKKNSIGIIVIDIFLR